MTFFTKYAGLQEKAYILVEQIYVTECVDEILFVSVTEKLVRNRLMFG